MASELEKAVNALVQTAPGWKQFLPPPPAVTPIPAQRGPGDQDTNHDQRNGCDLEEHGGSDPVARGTGEDSGGILGQVTPKNNGGPA